MPPNLCLAPVRGVTDFLFRRIFPEYFDGLDRTMAPFVVTVAGRRVKPSHLRDLSSWKEETLPLVPQALGRDPGRLAAMLRAFRELGFRSANLNAGCPHPRVIAHGHGAALLEDPATLRSMLEVGARFYPGRFSVKLRLGVDRADGIGGVAALCNDFPLEEVILHPRTAAQLYDGPVDLDGFARFLSVSNHRVVYNGDITEVAGFERIRKRFPSVNHWMVGRGMLRNPCLFAKPRGRDGAETPSRTERIGRFLFALWRAYESAMPPKTALGKIKNICRYLYAGPYLREPAWKSLIIIQTGREMEAWIGKTFLKN